MSLENLYQKALKEITNHWDEVLKLSQDDRCGIQGPTGLNELSNWLHELVSKDGPQSMFLDGGKLPAEKIYPKVLLHKNTRKQIDAELQVILPDAPEVNAILPVLVTGYIMNRRKSHLEDRAFPNGASSLYKSLQYEKTVNYSIKMSGTSLFRVKSWDKIFREVTYCQMTKMRMKKSLSYFGMLSLFLFLCYKMEESCNLTLSCDLFEEFTGYPGFCDKFFPRLKVETQLHTEDDPLKDEISSYLKELYEGVALPSIEGQFGSVELPSGIEELMEELCENYDLSNINSPLDMEDGVPDSEDKSQMDMVLERYIMFTIDALIRRARKSAVQNGEIFTKEDLSKNKWAESIWTDMILMFFREPFDWNEDQKTAR